MLLNNDDDEDFTSAKQCTILYSAIGPSLFCICFCQNSLLFQNESTCMRSIMNDNLIKATAIAQIISIHIFV